MEAVYLVLLVVAFIAIGLTAVYALLRLFAGQR